MRTPRAAGEPRAPRQRPQSRRRARSSTPRAPTSRRHGSLSTRRTSRGSRRARPLGREASRVQRCTRTPGVLAKRAEDRHDEAQVVMARIERAEQVERYGRERDVVAAYLAAREERAARWVALDRQADQLAVEDARELVDVVAHYERAESLAQHLGMVGDLDRVARKRPTVAQLRLETSRIVTGARRAEMRNPVAPAFLAEADLHYSVWARTLSSWRTSAAGGDRPRAGPRGCSRQALTSPDCRVPTRRRRCCRPRSRRRRQSFRRR